VINRHGPYSGLAGWFDINGSTATISSRTKNDQAAAANSLCSVGSANGIDCAVVTKPGKHDWPFASHAFAAALPWLAGQLGTPHVTPVPFPTRPTGPSFEQTAAR
jgi:S-formylglutathione hydrolase FrmB